ncbi:MAG: cofactor-independent phosphoglycerate mutase [Planctomycetaceae bacterium]
MKYALIIPDGCADEPQAGLSNCTPLQAANVPNMDAIAAAGIVGQANTVPASLPPGSDVGTMSLFGYDPLEFHTGRAPIEAAAQGIVLNDGDWAVRCNLVTVENEVMKSFTAGQVPNDVGAELVQRLQDDLPENSPWEFHAGVSYRNLLIYRSRGKTAPFSHETVTIPPHDITDQHIEPFLPQGPGSEELRQLMQRSRELFPESPLNRARLENGDLPVTQIWLWGQGHAPQMPSFKQRFGKAGAVITAVDLLRGLGRLLGWRIIDVPGATGYLDTNYAGKGQAAIGTFEEGIDFVVVHVEATDEASHEGDANEKVKALEQIDRHIVGPIHEYLKSTGDYRILVSPDHPTLLRTKTHSHGRVPFAMCGSGVIADDINSYDEFSAATGNLDISGHELLPRLFG